MAVNPCLVHSQRWRSDFQCVLNSMQKKNTLMIPVKYVRRIGGNVCTCDLDDDFMDDDITEISEEAVAEVNELKKFYNATNLSTDEKTKLGKAQPILTRLAADLSPEATGKIAFLNIIRDALVGRYERLEQDVQKPKDENDIDGVQWAEDVVTLPLAIEHVGHLFGKKGQRIKNIAKTYKCQIHVKNVEKKHHLVNFDFGAKEITVALRWNIADDDKIHLLKQHLQSVVKSIIVKRQRHEQAVKDYAEKRRKRVMQPSRSAGAGFKRYGPADTNFKAISEKQFERHHTGRAKSSKDRKQGNETHILDGGYCYFCNSSYWRKKKRNSTASWGADSDNDAEEGEVEDMEETETEDVPSPYADNACRYHSGYLVVPPDCPTKKSEKGRNHEWTCCSEVLLGLITDETMRQSHTSSGCQRGRHLWRPPNKKTDRCVSSKLQRSKEAIGMDYAV
ncbi:uncharacterized protein LOC135497808 [Lineus longissimus]|uniref:uncharacterized protein LOC135497808 n=1 Tax=Lineus longissimus TaxID=88925 RepID=UPI00315D9800